MEALEYGRWAEPSISFIGADVGSLPFRSSTFDVVIYIGVLHLIGDIKGVISEFSRVLKEGGSYSSLNPLLQKGRLVQLLQCSEDFFVI
ncbi:MAG TPA: class I SAM-dependent methyltransferase [Candidatus Korarchaeota archaeon]|nr:class I SAM-dependent methyltransferase [Candidatus Korarchaeota archaeon]